MVPAWRKHALSGLQSSWNKMKMKSMPWQSWSMHGQPVYGGSVELVHIRFHYLSWWGLWLTGLFLKRAPDLITGGCEPPCSCWELNSGRLEKQAVLLTAGLSLQPTKELSDLLIHSSRSLGNTWEWSLRVQYNGTKNTQLDQAEIVDICHWVKILSLIWSSHS